VNDRVKFRVWGAFGWRTTYVRFELLAANMSLLRSYGIKYRAVT
jgi:hypothetical protein